MPSKSRSSSQPKADPSSDRPGLLASVDRSAALWALAAGVAVALFMTAPVRDLYFTHFRSWEISDRPSTTGWAQFWRALAGPAVAVTFVGAVISGAVALVNVRQDGVGATEWISAVGRVVLAFLLSIVIEWTASGVQDGSSRDVDLVPAHSIAFLILALLLPWLFSAFDLVSYRNRSRA